MDTTKIQELLEIMARLRDPVNGCPWDVQQDFASIVPHTIEEAYEVAEAVAQNDMPALKDELGDLLLQVVFHAQMASEQGLFNFTDVAVTITEKLIRRHPHLFGDATIVTAEKQVAAWEAIKAAERKTKNPDKSVLADIPAAMPATSRAVKLQKRAASVGFDWPEAMSIHRKMMEELQEVQEAATKGKDALEEEIGDVLFTAVNLARHYKIDPESALRVANAKFERRFRHLEKSAQTENGVLEAMTLEEMELLWQHAKEAIKHEA